MTRQEVLQNYAPTGDNLISILHELQDLCEWNYLSRDDLQAAADYLNLPYSFVHGVATFYTMFSLEPRGKFVIRVCKSPPCQLMGATEISTELSRILGVDFGETTPDRLFSMEMTSCLGVCGVAPAVMINDQVYGNLTAERLQAIIEAKRREQ